MKRLKGTKEGKLFPPMRNFMEETQMRSTSIIIFLSTKNFKMYLNKLMQLNYAEILKSEFCQYVQAWVSIEKTEQYKEYVLEFLRSFLATVRANRKFVTVNM